MYVLRKRTQEELDYAILIRTKIPFWSEMNKWFKPRHAWFTDLGSIMKRLHRGVTFAGFPCTNPSQVSSLLLLGVGECGLEKSGHARRVVVWVGLQCCDVSGIRDRPERRVHAHPLAVDLIIR